MQLAGVDCFTAIYFLQWKCCCGLALMIRLHKLSSYCDDCQFKLYFAVVMLIDVILFYSFKFYYVLWILIDYSSVMLIASHNMILNVHEILLMDKYLRWLPWTIYTAITRKFSSPDLPPNWHRCWQPLTSCTKWQFP